jgi:hypothetical protein
MNKTIYGNYCREFTKLSLWYARKRILEGQSDFENALNERVNIFRHTSLMYGGKHPTKDDIPEWNAILADLEKVFDAHINDEDTAKLEDKGLAVLLPILEAKIDRFKLGRTEPRPYEAWTCDVWKNHVNIHIANTYLPESPLSEKRTEFAAALIRLLEDTQQSNPEVDTVSCGSWLNSVPTFLELFTEQWKRDGKAGRNVRYTLGHWGQFTDRRGDFHARNGARFRDTGGFPYPALGCNDLIEAVLAHLRITFPKSVEHNHSTHGRSLI